MISPMKKIFICLLSLAATATASAQTKAKLGLKAGLNIASTSNTESGESGSKAGAHAGVLAHIHLTPAVALQPELVYSNQGGEFNGVKVNLHYVNIPVNLQYNFNNGFRIQTGPQVGFLVGVDDREDGNETNYFSTDDFKSTDVSWTLGLGYLSNSGLGIDGRYNLGLSKINADPTRGGKTTNRVFQIGLFYMFDNAHKAKSR
jgi:hypothetical protein